MEACGLSDLGREDRILLAQEIIESSDLKQQICNDADGLSYRDIEKVLSEILRSKADRSSKNSKRKEKQNNEQDFESESADSPEEEHLVEVKRKKLKLVYLIDQEEVNTLIEASLAPPVIKSTISSGARYDTYTQRECNDLISG
jgi:hypothetical protein